MDAIINNLQQHQKALLFFSLNQTIEKAETQIALATLNDCHNSVRLFAKFTLDETKALQQKLFGDTFVEEMDFVLHFAETHHVSKQEI